MFAVSFKIKMYSSIWILIVTLCGVVAEWNTKDHLKREHSLTKPYIGNSLLINVVHMSRSVAQYYILNWCLQFIFRISADIMQTQLKMQDVVLLVDVIEQNMSSIVQKVNNQCLAMIGVRTFAFLNFF